MIAIADQADIAGRNAMQDELVEIATAVRDHIVAVTAGIDVGVIAFSGLQRIVAGAALQDVSGVEADDGVVA